MRRVDYIPHKGYITPRPGHEGCTMGPFDTKELAHWRATIYERCEALGVPYPRQYARYTHVNGGEYVVLVITGEHSDPARPQYAPRVVYQGTNGRVWDKPWDDFVTHMKFQGYNKGPVEDDDELFGNLVL